MDNIESYYLRGRMENAWNPHQGDKKRVLCICSAGLLRSPTIAWILSNAPWNYNTRAAGSEVEYALIQVNDVLLHWAQELVFVNRRNLQSVAKRFALDKHTIHTLDLPDRFVFRDPELVEIARKQLTEAGV